MDSVTMNKNLETDETKFLDVHGTCAFQPQDLVGLYFFHLTHDERVPFE
jgi:hypothetical protein